VGGGSDEGLPLGKRLASISRERYSALLIDAVEPPSSVLASTADHACASHNNSIGALARPATRSGEPGYCFRSNPFWEYRGRFLLKE